MKLLPCPFCGSPMSGRTEYEFYENAVMPWAVAVVCSTCSARGPFIGPSTGDENRTCTDARRAWNERAKS